MFNIIIIETVIYNWVTKCPYRPELIVDIKMIGVLAAEKPKTSLSMRKYKYRQWGPQTNLLFHQQDE